MKDSRPHKKDWVLTQEAFHKLLQWFDPSEELAGLKYEHIRRSLILFFRAKGRDGGEELADETINRVARRISEGVEIKKSKQVSYFMGVAVNVLHEDIREQKSSISSPPPTDHQELENKLECQERCFQALDLETRAFLREYCEGDYEASLKRRKKMAASLGISLNALRLRVYHHREDLADCMKKCLEEKMN